MDESDILEDISDIFEQHDFEENSLTTDGILGSIANMLIPSEERTTFQAANLGYQILCYQVFRLLRLINEKLKDSNICKHMTLVSSNLLCTLTLLVYLSHVFIDYNYHQGFLRQ